LNISESFVFELGLSYRQTDRETDRQTDTQTLLNAVLLTVVGVSNYSMSIFKNL